jgi:hypothetical protein
LDDVSFGLRLTKWKRGSCGVVPLSLIRSTAESKAVCIDLGINFAQLKEIGYVLPILFLNLDIRSLDVLDSVFLDSSALSFPSSTVTVLVHLWHDSSYVTGGDISYSPQIPSTL